MRHYIKVLLSLFVVILLSVGCSQQKMANKIKREIGVEAIEDISGSINGGWVITLRVRNETGYEPTLSVAEGEVYVDGVMTAKISLMSPVTMPKKAISSIDIPLEIGISNAIKVLALVMKAKSNDFSGVEIAYNGTIELMGIKKSFGTEKTQVTTILKQLGYK
ncbi:MAG: hypothetical protein IIW50_07350 [Alistipes sp.]|nr:hypothetical protein [Alistipes sp.]